MHHESDLVVVVDCEEELAGSYVNHKPRSGQFSILFPYQHAEHAIGAPSQVPSAHEQADACIRPPDQRKRARHDRHVTDAPQAGVTADQQDPAANSIRTLPAPTRAHNHGNQPEHARCKRQQRSPYQPTAREVEAQERHAELYPFLVSAYAAFQAWLSATPCTTVGEAVRWEQAQVAETAWLLPASQSPDVAVPRPAPGSVVRSNAAHSELKTCKQGAAAVAGARLATRSCNPSQDIPFDSTADTAAAGDHEGWDLVALAELRLVLRPKLRIIGSIATHMDQQRPHAEPLEPGSCSPRCEDLHPDDIVIDNQRMSGNIASGEVRPLSLTGTPAANTDTESGNLFGRLITNERDEEVVALAHETPVLLPKHTQFLMSDVKLLQPLLAGAPAGGFHCILLDPPWENASARRGAKYPSLPSRNLLSIPIPQLLHADGLVALWVTNRERLRRFVDAELLPAWGLQPVAQWVWLKVTDSGQLVSPLEVAHRRPYEVLLLARPKRNPAASSEELQALRSHRHQEAASAATYNAHMAGPSDLPQLPRQLAIVAVPGEHSRKPQLGRLLRRYLPLNPHCLEMFARELAADWTSWGNEALRFQTLNRFVSVS